MVVELRFYEEQRNLRTTYLEKVKAMANGNDLVNYGAEKAMGQSVWAGMTLGMKEWVQAEIENKAARTCYEVGKLKESYVGNEDERYRFYKNMEEYPWEL